MKKEEVIKIVLEQGLTITDVIDAVIELNGIIGVGLITLGEQLNNYCIYYHKSQKNIPYENANFKPDTF